MALTALANGTLIAKDGCLWLRADQDYLIIWPTSYRAGTQNGRLLVEDETGERRAYIGDRVTVAGGELASGVDPADEVETLIGRQVPEACRTPFYWIGGLS